MSSTKMWLLVGVMILMPVMVLAEGDIQNSHGGLTLPGFEQSLLSGMNSGFSLLDPQRFKMSQSYGLTYSYYSRNRGGDLVGLYQNMMSYRFSSQLNVQVGLGYLHRPAAALSGNDTIRNQALMTAFQVDFRPFDKVFIHFNYQSLPVIDDHDPLWRYRNSWGSWGW